MVVESVSSAVLTSRREVGVRHSLKLDPQHHDGIGSGRTGSRSYDTSQGQVSTPMGRSVGGATKVTSAPNVDKEQHI